MLPANAINIKVDRGEVNGTYPEGARLSLTCKNGYRAFGSSCQADGSWEPDYRCASNNITSFHTLRNGFELMVLGKISMLGKTVVTSWFKTRS